MFKKSIKRRILDAVSAKIDELQKVHDDRVSVLNEEHEIAVLKVADEIVQNFLSKVL